MKGAEVCVVPTKKEYREWLLTLTKADLADLVVEMRETLDFVRGQRQLADLEADYLRSQGDAVANERARHAGFARAVKCPKAKAKQMAFVLWRERFAGQHPKLRTNEQFAIECMRRWPVLTSAKVICNWCTDWTKAAKSQPAS